MKHTNQVDVPLLFFSLGFFIILFGLFSKLTFQQKKFVEPQQTQIVSQKAQQKKLPQLDYNKPLNCEYQSKDASISAALQGTSIFAQVFKNKNTQVYVVEGDCLFSWIKNERVGKKQCGIGQYIGIGKQLLGSGLASVDTIGSMMGQMGKSTSIDIHAVLETCKNVKEMEKKMFDLPKNVMFK